MNLGQDYGWYFSLLWALSLQVPLYLVYLVGGIIAIIRWERHSRVSLILLVSIAISLVAGIAFTVIYAWLPYYLAASKVDTVSYSYYFYSLSIVNNLIHVFTFALMLLAVFAERPQISQSGEMRNEKLP